jgi:hypothetical protein
VAQDGEQEWTVWVRIGSKTGRVWLRINRAQDWIVYGRGRGGGMDVYG